MRAVADDIRAIGWSVSAVLGDAIAPPWAYTVGLWLSQQGPELTMFGLPVEHMTVILNSIGDRVATGAVIEAGDYVDGICPCPLAIRPVDASWRTTSMFAVSDRYHGYVRPPYLQVVWPDRRDRYPGDAGFSPGTRAGSRCCGCRVTTTRRRVDQDRSALLTADLAAGGMRQRDPRRESGGRITSCRCTRPRWLASAGGC